MALYCLLGTGCPFARASVQRAIQTLRLEEGEGVRTDHVLEPDVAWCRAMSWLAGKPDVDGFLNVWIRSLELRADPAANSSRPVTLGFPLFLGWPACGVPELPKCAQTSLAPNGQCGPKRRGPFDSAVLVIACLPAEVTEGRGVHMPESRTNLCLRDFPHCSPTSRLLQSRPHVWSWGIYLI